MKSMVMAGQLRLATGPWVTVTVPFFWSMASSVPVAWWLTEALPALPPCGRRGRQAGERGLEVAFGIDQEVGGDHHGIAVLDALRAPRHGRRCARRA
jgi:hypothetical protein